MRRFELLEPTSLREACEMLAADEISYDPERGLRLGALATIHHVERAAVVREHYPMLAEACHVVANIRIRNSATIGGNVAHGDYQSDPPTALLALESRVELTSLQ